MNTTPETDRAYRPGPHWFALLGTIFTWPLLFVGGMVTSYRVGMAVPDWPTTFGINMFLYDMTRAPWGVFGEHSHRLYGAAVGLFTLLLTIDLLVFERRRSVKILAVVALVAVIGQGLLGGGRIRLNSTVLAAVHGVTGQMFFGLMVVLCVLTGRGSPPQASDKLRKMAVALLALVLVQITVGAWLRHFPNVAALRWHSVLAVVVFGHAIGTIVRSGRRRGLNPAVVPATRALEVALTLQIVLGVAAWWLLRPYDGTERPVTLIPALIRTGHQANAGLLLAAVVVLTLRAFGLPTGDGAGRVADDSERTTRELEAVA